MSLTNRLPLIFQSFTFVQESLKAAKLIVNNPSQYPRSVLAKMPHLNNSVTPPKQLDKSLKEIEDLFVLNLWATFERWLRDYLQEKGETLKTTIPTELGSSLYEHFEKEVEYWKPESMLDILKSGVFSGSEANKQLVGHAKQILDYRNWIAHGRNPNRCPATRVLLPEEAYKTLNTIITLVKVAMLKESIEKVKQRLQTFEQEYGMYEPESLYGQVDDMVLVEWEGDIETLQRLQKKLASFEEIILE